MHNRILFYLIFLVVGPGLSCSLQEPRDLISEESDFQIEPGLIMQLIASEPLVIDPVAFTFDEQREMYVVENRGYPDPAEGGAPATKEGRIAKLSDLDHDGIYDQRVEYAQDFTYPNGIMYWKGGVFVTCAPDIFYLKDTTGDGVADIRKVVLTGFYDTKTAQIRMSHPILGLDGWIYVTGGLNGGEISSPEHPDRDKVIYSNGDGRFHPETLEFQVAGGNSQFGLTFDAFGRRFGCSNRHPVMQAMLELVYLNRNPHLLFNEIIQNVSKVQADAVVYPISGAAITADFIPSLIGRSHQGTFTSASGTFVLTDESLGADHNGNFFICESAQNMVQRQIVSSSGPSFTSTIATDGTEFLASKNEWFRPVFLGVGPSSGLYIADMHRKVIDHPSYVPESMRDQLDFQSGRDMGRIYQMTGKEVSKAQYATFGDDISIVELLNSSSEWNRITAFRILLEKKPKGIESALKKISIQGVLPESRVRAAWLLKHLGQLYEQVISKLARDPVSGVREQAVFFVSELPTENPARLKWLVDFANDQDARVRFLTALQLGDFLEPLATKALARIAAIDGEQQWTRAAVLSGIGSRMSSFLEFFQDQNQFSPGAMSTVMKDLSRLFGNGASITACSELMKEIIQKSDDQRWQASAALGLAEGVYGRPDFKTALKKSIFREILGPSVTDQDLQALDEFISGVIQVVQNKGAQLSERRTSVLILGFTPANVGFPILESIINDPAESELHAEVIKALTQQGFLAGGEILTKQSTWSSFTPSVRSLVLSSLISKRDYIQLLFKAIEEGLIQTAEISSSDRHRLMSSQDPAIKNKAKDIFNELEAGSRIQVYESYKSLDLTGDKKIGKGVFVRTCSVCHTYAGEGGNVGPDLTGVKNQPADALLMHTLVPNYEVYPNYVAVIIETKSGESFAGWIETESDNSLTLRTSSGSQQSILRSNIKTLTNTGKSLMPDGLEQTMTQKEMIDLISYLKSGG
ncbi:MAG: c-type cytochrome [Saprospiraceae bacterium]|nr:c-type cytochrome [Saprospiraceae bacterium]